MTRRVLVIGLFAALSVVAALAVADTGESAESVFATESERLLHFCLGGIEDGLRRSPDRYFAAFAEVVGEPECREGDQDPACFQDHKILELYAERGTLLHEGDVVRLVGKGTLGSKTLFFAVPLKPNSDVYGRTFLSLGTGAEDLEVLKEALGRAGL